MTHHDGENSGSDDRTGVTGASGSSPAGPDSTDSTGTWAFVSPFATPPEAYAPPNEPRAWGAAPARPADPTGSRPPSRWKTWQKAAAGGVLAAVVLLGGVAAVSAASASSSDTATGQAGFAGGGQDAGGGDGRSGGGRGAMAGAMALANALHGEFVVAEGTGTTTMRLQVGEVAAVAADSITVTSTDGFSASYAIGSGVDVSGVSQGDTVRVIATVDGNTATATSVSSGTTGSGGFGPGGMPGQGQTGQGPDGQGMAPPTGDQAPPTS